MCPSAAPSLALPTIAITIHDAVCYAPYMSAEAILNKQNNGVILLLCADVSPLLFYIHPRSPPIHRFLIHPQHFWSMDKAVPWLHMRDFRGQIWELVFLVCLLVKSSQDDSDEQTGLETTGLIINSFFFFLTSSYSWAHQLLLLNILCPFHDGCLLLSWFQSFWTHTSSLSD